MSASNTRKSCNPHYHGTCQHCICLTVLHNLGSVGAGTIIAAILVGTLVGIINRAFCKQRDKLLGKTEETAQIIRELFQKKMGVS